MATRSFSSVAGTTQNGRAFSAHVEATEAGGALHWRVVSDELGWIPLVIIRHCATRAEVRRYIRASL